MGTVFVNVTTPPGSSLSQTKRTMDQVAESIREIPQIKQSANVTGYSMLGGQAPSGGMLIIKLKHWDERPEDSDYITAVINQIYACTAHVKSGKVYAFAQPTIMGYGMSNGFELYVQDRAGGDINTLQEHVNRFIAALNQRPEITMAYTSFDTKFPQYIVDVDAARCKRANVSPSDVLSVLSGFIGGSYSSNFNRFSKLYRVMIQAKTDYRIDKNALNNMFVRTGSGEMAPVGQFITLTKVYGAETLTRFNLYSSIAVNGTPADGYSTGDAINAIDEVANQTLPTGYGYEFSGMTWEESGNTNTTILIFGLCIIFVYLILCALYESVFIPLAVMLSVPFGLMGTFPFLRAGKQYLYAGRIDHVDRFAGENCHIADRICFYTPQRGDVHCFRCHIGCRCTFAAYSDDGPYHDYRYVTACVCIGGRSERKYFIECRSHRRYAYWYIGTAFCNTGIFYRISDFARTCNARTEY